MKNRKQVRIHKDGETATIQASAAGVWVRRGWTLVDDGSSETPAQNPEQPQVDADQLSLLDHENKE